MQLLHKMLTAGTKSVERSVVCALNNPVVFIFRHVLVAFCSLVLPVLVCYLLRMLSNLLLCV